ncbi:MAG: class C beta-lactamase-related serine hydrolase [Comamonadaceae bacterium]|nr:MAG: class C beta-lactamase-related serine hydrolase [Comamonadaceae bacterium]
MQALMPAAFTRRALLLAASATASLRLGDAVAQPAESAGLQALRERLDAGYGDVRSIVVLRQGQPLFEYQRNGDPDTLHDVQSVAKSGLSALVGIALADGRIASLDQPVVALMPELSGVNADPRAAQVTVRHLLTMTSGLDTQAKVDGRDLAREAIARPFKSAPGEVFAYDNLGYWLLTRVVETAVGQPLPAWAEAKLLQPLGIARVRWPGEQGNRWMLGMRTRDMATLGQLFLQDGHWGERQIVPADYVRAATQRQNAGGPPVGMDYGYMWWVVPGPGPATARRTFMASGYGGQLIWVHPPLDLVVAMTSEASAASQARGQAIQLLRGPLLAAAQGR